MRWQIHIEHTPKTNHCQVKGDMGRSEAVSKLISVLDTDSTRAHLAVEEGLVSERPECASAVDLDAFVCWLVVFMLL